MSPLNRPDGSILQNTIDVAPAGCNRFFPEDRYGNLTVAQSLCLAVHSKKRHAKPFVCNGRQWAGWHSRPVKQRLERAQLCDMCERFICSRDREGEASDRSLYGVAKQAEPHNMCAAPRDAVAVVVYNVQERQARIWRKLKAIAPIPLNSWHGSQGHLSRQCTCGEKDGRFRRWQVWIRESKRGPTPPHVGIVATCVRWRLSCRTSAAVSAGYNPRRSETSDFGARTPMPSRLVYVAAGRSLTCRIVSFNPSRDQTRDRLGRFGQSASSHWRTPSYSPLNGSAFAALPQLRPGEAKRFS